MGVMLACNFFLISWQAAVSQGKLLGEVLDVRRNKGSRRLLMAWQRQQLRLNRGVLMTSRDLDRLVAASHSTYLPW
jgi:hypothetical protein